MRQGLAMLTGAGLRAASAAALLAASACGPGEAMHDEGPEPDWILHAGSVITGDPARPRAASVAVRDGRILALGGRDAIGALAGPRTQVEDLGAATIVPGLVDAHGHVLGLGFTLRRVDLRGAATFEEMIERVRRQAAKQPAGSWILGRGWDQTLWPGGEFPSHAALSAAVPDHPVLVDRVDGHASIANARALALAGVARGTADPDGGRILRDARGDPTGVLIDNAAERVGAAVTPPSRAEQKAALEAALRHLVALGLTGVHDAGIGFSPANGLDDETDPGWHTVDLYRELLAEGRVPLRVYAMLGGNSAYPPEDSYFARPPVLGEGDGRLTVRAIKIGVDGALGSRGAALDAPYHDEPSGQGLLTRDEETVRRLVARAMGSGWQIAIHAIGDRANRIALDAIDAARATGAAGDLRPRIEHAQVLRPADIARFGPLGAIASVQPTHATSDMRWAEERVGPERIAGAYAYAALARSGAHVACGSDFPVENASPLEGLHAAVTRQDLDGRPAGGWRMSEALTVAEALTCFTAGPAFASFTEGELGRIAPGYRADLTVLDRDPTAVPAGELPGLRVLRTIVGGRVTHDGSAAR